MFFLQKTPLNLLAVLLCALQLTTWCQAQTQSPQLLLLVSQRNAETIAEAARQFHQQYPQLVITARTDVQLWEMAPAQQQALIDSHDLVLGIGLFGASVAELEPRLRNSATPRLIFNSDHRLIKLSQTSAKPLFSSDEQVRELAGSHHGTDFDAQLSQLQQHYPAQADWLAARRYWQAGGSYNTAGLLAWAFDYLKQAVTVPAPQPLARLRWRYQGQFHNSLTELQAGPVLVVMDHAGGDRPADSALLDEICSGARAKGMQCLVALAYWGEAGVAAVQALQAVKAQLASIVMLQDFVIGGGEGREAVTAAFTTLNVPVLKAIKLRDRTAAQWQLSADGLAYDKVYYQVAMPELQGASQSLVIATAGQQQDDPITGIRIQPIQAETGGVDTLLARAANWHQLRVTENSDKRIAIVYYNHPPGRHNIGADNLDVPASLWQILQRLKQQGYHTGTLPASQEALLDVIQARGINLPNDAQALKTMSGEIKRLPAADYQQWFSTLPARVQREMTDGPFGLLHEQIKAAVAADKRQLALQALEHADEEMHHLLEGVDHPARERALSLMEQLEQCYLQSIEQPNQPCWEKAETLIAALQKTGIEGLGGWGQAPGKVMTYQGEMLLPGIQFGNVFIGPQPPRGWEINEELLHANLAFPPPHQYLGFYYFLHNQFQADAIIHLGRHSTYEFLPRRSVGLAEDDYSRLIAGEVPGIYPYIVDGVGEGIQAKRRGMAVMVDHLTPPLESTPLYDELLQLRQLVESFETSHGTNNEALAQRLVQQIRDKVDALELKDELAEAMSAELAVMGISFDEVDDDMLVHEVGHYLTDLQERFMPLGLHSFGTEWREQGVTKMLTSMAPADEAEREQWRTLLTASPAAEMDALLRAMDGGFVAPGPGNDPIRSPEALPTGRNFFALDNSLIPSPVAWELGSELAQQARQNNSQNPEKREALVLWASDVVRDEGVMIAFGLNMLGLKPVWNSRGLVKGLEYLPLADDRVRRDMVFTTSGLFRDLYSRQMTLLNEAVLLAIQASGETIQQQHPALTLALQQTLAPLSEADMKHPLHYGNDSLTQNQVAAHWVEQTRSLMAQGYAEAEAGLLASLRVFGDAPGSYGAGINRLVERSGAWEQREQLADVYLRRLGHSFGGKDFGKPVEAVFRSVLSDVENTYLGRSSNLYGLIDNNDAFDYLGGLSLAVETLTGSAPNNFVINHADPQRMTTQPLSIALRQELRGRFLNPQWLQGLMEHGYAGARTMGSEFLEYLWGWQVTNPTLVGDWVWNEVKAVYIDDRYDLELDEFLEQGHNVHVKSNMLAIMLVAIHKGFWQADAQTTEQLAQQFAELVTEHGLPGSGHTTPDHPMLQWAQQFMPEALQQQLQQVIEKARQQPETAIDEIHRLMEIELQSEATSDNADPTSASEQTDGDSSQMTWWLAAALLVVVIAGFARALRQQRQLQR